MTVTGRAAMAMALCALFCAENGQIQNELRSADRDRYNGDDSQAAKYRADRAERKRAAYMKRNKAAIGDKP